MSWQDISGADLKRLLEIAETNTSLFKDKIEHNSMGEDYDLKRELEFIQKLKEPTTTTPITEEGLLAMGLISIKLGEGYYKGGVQVYKEYSGKWFFKGTHMSWEVSSLEHLQQLFDCLGVGS